MARRSENRCGSMLLAYRRSAKLTQEALAERAGVSAHSISNLERGVPHGPRKDTIELLADALHLTVDQRAEFLAAAHAIQRGALPLAHTQPFPATSLIGREADVCAASDLLDRGQVRLLTFCGPPGVGKTRLALEVVRRKESDFPHGSVFVSLAPLTDPTLVEVAIAHALGVTEKGGAGLLREQLVAALGGKRLLLLLDNFEHLLSQAPLVSELLAAAPGLRVIATSRAPLRLQGEQEYPVAPLALPDGSQLHLTPKDFASVPAVALFIARARAVRPAWSPSLVDLERVAAICRRLDGLPLAIELAAAHIRVFSPQALLAHLSQHQPLLDAAARDVPPRQRTLQDAIAWSYRLLRPDVQLLFRHLAVFAGSFSPEAVAATVGEQAPAQVSSLGASDAVLPRVEDCTSEMVGGVANVANVEVVSPSMLAGLSTLVEHNLLHSAGGPDGTSRFVLLATIREFAAGQLVAHGEAESAYICYTKHYVRLAAAAALQLVGPEQQRWLARLDDERDNLREALRWALEWREAEGVELAGRLVGGVWRFWLRRGLLSEGRSWVERTIALAEAVDPSLSALSARTTSREYRGEQPAPGLDRVVSYAQLHYAAGVLTQYQYDFPQALAHYEACRTLRQAVQDKWGLAAVLNGLGEVAREQGQFARAVAYYQESLALKRELGDLPGTARTLSNLALAFAAYDESDTAMPLVEESLRLFRQVGDEGETARVLGNLGEVERRRGNWQQAEQWLQEGQQAHRAIGNPLGSAFCLGNLGDITMAKGRFAKALAYFRDALAIYAEAGVQLGVAQGLEGVARAVGALGERREAKDALKLVAAAANLRRVIAAPRDRNERQHVWQLLRHVRAHAGVSGEEARAAWREGARLPLAQATALATALAEQMRCSDIGDTPS